MANTPTAPSPLLGAHFSGYVTRRPEPICVLDDRRIAVHRAGSTDVLDWWVVIAAKANGNTSALVTENGDVRVRAALAFVVSRLECLGLVQVHRGAAVNIARVRRLVGHRGHRVTIVVDGLGTVGVGRSYQTQIRARFGARTRPG